MRGRAFGTARATYTVMNLTDRNVGRIPQTRVSRASTITLSDVRAYRARNPLCTESDDAVRALVLAERPCDLGFEAR